MDKNGKIGGKVNLIDLLIIIVLVVVVAFVGYRFIGQDSVGVVNDTPVTVKLISSEVPNFVVDKLTDGMEVRDFTENNALGSITDIEVDEPYSYTVTDEGNTVELKNPTCSSVIVTTEVNGTLDENGLTIGGTRYGVGHSLVVYAGNCKLWVQVYDIEAA